MSGNRRNCLNILTQEFHNFIGQHKADKKISLNGKGQQNVLPVSVTSTLLGCWPKDSIVFLV